MKREPLGGDVAPLRGTYQGSLRLRVGPWRIIFSLDLEAGNRHIRHPSTLIDDVSLNSEAHHAEA
jgi:hypothetical protein